MNSLEKAVETQLQNIQKKTGKTLEELCTIIKQSGLSRHGELRDMLKRDLGLGHGDANTLVHYALKSSTDQVAEGKQDVLAEIYTGAKAALRPIHERLMEAIAEFGAFEIVPKKGYVSLRRKKQFVMLKPATNTRFEVGLNVKGLEITDRLKAMPIGAMCNYKVNLTDVREVDAELIAWIRQAYESAG